MCQSIQSDSDSVHSWQKTHFLTGEFFSLAEGMSRSKGITAFAGIFRSATNIGMLFLVRMLIAGVINGQAFFQIAPVITGIILLFLIRGVADSLRDISAQRTADLMKYRVRSRVYEHLLRQGPAYTEHKSSGSVAATISDGVDSLEQYVGFFPLPHPLFCHSSSPLCRLHCSP